MVILTVTGYTIMVISAFMIIYAMVGYPILLSLLDRIIKPPKIKKDYHYEPNVSYIIVAHNEESVILRKLQNALQLDYPNDKFEIIITSDFSTDRTNNIVENFISDHSERRIVLHKTVEHKGKTNAQNEAQKISSGEILVMTDANALLKENAIRELVSCFTDNDIAYVCGKLEYSNNLENPTSTTETTYWNLDLKMRDIESRFQTITAGNGSIYAVRNQDYIEIPLIRCHDGAMPYQYALRNKRSLFNPDAISYEKAGEENYDEFKRKVRMNRTILDIFIEGPKVFNPFKYRWFSFFYFGHRTCRYLLWLSHLFFWVFSIIYAIINRNIWFTNLVVIQAFFICVGCYSISHSFKNKILRIIGYYSMTIMAQLVSVYRQITGKAKPIWEKAESTR